MKLVSGYGLPVHEVFDLTVDFGNTYTFSGTELKLRKNVVVSEINANI